MAILETREGGMEGERGEGREWRKEEDAEGYRGEDRKEGKEEREEGNVSTLGGLHCLL